MRLLFGALCLCLGLLPLNRAQAEILDLSHPFDSQTIYWPTAEPFELETVSKGRTEGGYYYEANNYRAAEHGGTHLDAPVHFAEGRWTVEEIPLEHLIGPAVVVDMSEAAARDRDAQLMPADLVAWEQAHGRIPDGCILMVHTGWGGRWPDKKRYLGTAEKGDVAHLHFPGIHPSAAQWIVDHRRVKVVGIDTPSIDYGQSRDFRTHVILYEKNIPGLENVANLEQLPAKGTTVYAIPMNIRGGSGAPCRIFAVDSRSRSRSRLRSNP